MSTNKTTHYQLNQWEAEDKVLRTEFNEDNQKIDGALAGLNERLGELDQAMLQDKAALEEAKSAWTDKTTVHLLKTETLAVGGDNFKFSLSGIAWDNWRLIHLIIEPKVKDSQGASLYLDGGKQLLSMVGYGRTHIILYPWYHGGWPFRGFYLSGGFGYFEDPLSFQAATGLTMIKSFPDYPLLAGCKITMYGEK